MGVIARYELYCNGLTQAPGDRKRTCTKTYKAPADHPSWPKPAELRKLAAREGWTTWDMGLGRRFLYDLCPDHKRPEGDGNG